MSLVDRLLTVGAPGGVRSIRKLLEAVAPSAFTLRATEPSLKPSVGNADPVETEAVERSRLHRPFDVAVVKV